MLSEENVMLSEENVMLSEAERSRSISRVVVIKRYCNEASEMLRLRGRQMSMTFLLSLRFNLIINILCPASPLRSK